MGEKKEEVVAITFKLQMNDLSGTRDQITPSVYDEAGKHRLRSCQTLTPLTTAAHTCLYY